MRNYKLKDLFDIVFGGRISYNTMTPYAEGVPFISRQSVNNGIKGRVRKKENEKLNPKNTISVACSGSVMSSFLQEEEYYSGNDICYLTPKIPMSKKKLLFYCLVLRKNAYRFNYGRQANKTLKDLFVPGINEIPLWVDDTNLNISFNDKIFTITNEKLDTF